jgi:glutamate synthase domain-containing protein 2/glutamate synthase domain-containing protein 1/glutamate synthase domain-containing protein 3
MDDHRDPAPGTFVLYDPRLHHDACGIGLVVDVAGRRQGAVLPLALAGLAALGHRGAFAADGVSSDGAGISVPLSRDLRRRLAPDLSGPFGVVVVFLPQDRAGQRLARDLIVSSLAREGLSVARWRDVPTRDEVLGREAAASRPVIVQALVPRPPAVDGRTFQLRLVCARRRLETAAREAGLSDLAVPSASASSVVYKALVAGAHLADFYPDLLPPLAVRYALFHQRYATNTQPVWRLAQPFRSLAHNGEINTVRGNRQELVGRMADRSRRRAAKELLAAGPLLSPDGSDSLSLDETVELLVSTGWSLPDALLALLPEAQALRRIAHPGVAAFARATRGFLAPWDGPAAIVFADDRWVGAVLDRNGLRPAVYAVTRDGLVAVASEAGAVPLDEGAVVRRGRLGPGELFLVDLRAGRIFEDAEAKGWVLHHRIPDDEVATVVDDPWPVVAYRREIEPTPAGVRFLAGLDAEGFRLHLRTMALEGHQPLWSMGDDTPTPALGRVDRPVAHYLRQSFAQVTNPPIDPEREEAVLDLGVVVGPRPPLLGGPPWQARRRRCGVHLTRPFVAHLEALCERLSGPVVQLDATWPADAGPAGLEEAVRRLAEEGIRAARRGAWAVVVSHRRVDLHRLPVPGVLAVGAVHAALVGVGLRGRCDILADLVDTLDVHGAAMVLAAGATVLRPRLALEVAAELAGGRGAEGLGPEEATANLLAALTGGLRKTLARMGISTAASYVGGGFFEVLELAPEVIDRCFPAAPAWPGRVGFAELASRQLARRAVAVRIAGETPPHRLPDPGLARFRMDGELHANAPATVGEIQRLAAAHAPVAVPVSESAGGVVPAEGSAEGSPRAGREGEGDPPAHEDDPLELYRRHLASRPPATVRDQLVVVPPAGSAPIPLDAVEPATAIVRRFVAAAMSLGALSPEAHQAITLGIQLVGGAANTGEGGEDPTWYEPGPDGRRRDARIKQVASARFGVTAAYLARADQIEIKIAQGSKPGEGGHLPGRKATAYIAALRRGRPGQSYISPPPHHDIYSIEDLAQLIADLRAINPRARIGVKLVATRGVGTIAAGVAKAGADVIHVAGHAGGTGASPLASIKHAGVPWELGLAEVHETLVRQGLRDRVALRVDGGLQRGRDIVVAALLGAEEFAFGTALLIAIGCDMARQCHLDTCPTGVATQRPELRARFRGRPEDVAGFVTAVAEDVRRELASLGVRSVGEIVGEARRFLRPSEAATLDLGPLVGLSPWPAAPERRADPAAAARVVSRAPASPLEEGLVARLRGGQAGGQAAAAPAAGQGGLGRPDGWVSSLPVVLRGAVTTAERSLGARLSGALERGEVKGPLRLELRGAAGQSLGAFLTEGLELRLTGVANDYVAKGLSGGTVVVAPEPGFPEPHRQAIVGNTCLYGATGGRLHVLGRAGIRFAVRNSGAAAVVEGVGPHACEYMTAGTVVILGPVGANLGAGMTGGRVYLYDPAGRHLFALDGRSVMALRLAQVAEAGEATGRARLEELTALLVAHRDAGSALAERILAAGLNPKDFWVVEPLADASLAVGEGEPVARAAGA